VTTWPRGWDRKYAKVHKDITYPKHYEFRGLLCAGHEDKSSSSSKKEKMTTHEMKIENQAAKATKTTQRSKRVRVRMRKFVYLP